MLAANALLLSFAAIVWYFISYAPAYCNQFSIAFSIDWLHFITLCCCYNFVGCWTWEYDLCKDQSACQYWPLSSEHHHCLIWNLIMSTLLVFLDRVPYSGWFRLSNLFFFMSLYSFVMVVLELGRSGIYGDCSSCTDIPSHDHLYTEDESLFHPSQVV